jgi:hypothetical protein
MKMFSFECHLALVMALLTPWACEARSVNAAKSQHGFAHRGQADTHSSVPAALPAAKSSNLRSDLPKSVVAAQSGKHNSTDSSIALAHASKLDKLNSSISSKSSSGDVEVSDDTRETVEQIQREAAAEEEEDDKEIAAEEGNETKAEKEKDIQQQGEVHQKVVSNDEAKQAKIDVEPLTTTPPSEPYQYMYDHADAVARDAELRRGVEFHPQGTNPVLDKSKRQQFVTDTFFSQDPSIFGHCVLIRDFAEPLRVGSAMMRKESVLHHHRHRHRRSDAQAETEKERPKPPSFAQKERPKWHPNFTQRVEIQRLRDIYEPHHAQHPHIEPHHEAFPHSFVRAFASSEATHRTGDIDKTSDRVHRGEEPLPDEVLVLKGGVVDREVGEVTTEDGHEEDDAEFEVNMFAWLRSIAGEVAVIPNGEIHKWSSKKKVPIAGYLCTTDQGPVLHTLPTPCLPTALDSNGQAFPPPVAPTMPPGPPPMPKKVPPQPPSGVAAAPSAPPAPMTVTGLPVTEAPAAAPQTVTGLPEAVKAIVHENADPLAAVHANAKDVNKLVSDMTDEDIEAQAEREAAEAEAIASGPETVSMLQMRGSRRAMKEKFGPAPSAAQSGSAPSPMAAGPSPAPANVLVDQPFHVWVGSTLLEFRSKPKAERFCKRLATRIAEDSGDTEWDSDRILPETVGSGLKDMSVSNFMARARKPAPSWTTGTKSLLVVVLDWMQGDNSRPPYTEQTKTPAHYRDRIFPRVRQAFQKMSFGLFDVSVTVLPEVVRYSKPRSRYTAGGYPFPGLYNGAKDTVEGRYGQKYSFNNYDLVYTISPQQAPTGTKGVAWVGAKGAMCNGCEAISDNFQVMVAVHELGHNLGLWHASSTSLEYGNVFDWMGNYPDVSGLSYGLGYKLKLNWLPEASIWKIQDKELASLNDEFHIMPFDGTAPPVSGQLTGIRIDLKRNRRDLYVAYRKEPGTGKNGIFLTYQDRDKPNSELIDCACHSPSQQDAALRQGWTYMDPTGQVVISVVKIAEKYATLRIYKAPTSRNSLAAIRARQGFTDGTYQCPRVCTDADLLVSLYKGCGMLAQDGYCNGGSITMGGKKLKIGTDLCPKSCDQCAAVEKGGSLAQTAGCGDKNVKISGMSCPQVARKGYCDYSTNIGHIGNDLCPASCGRCPAKPPPAGSANAGSFSDPTPARSHGVKAAAAQAPPMGVESEQDRNNAAAAAEADEEKAADDQDDKDQSAGEDSHSCTDDVVWSDADGDGCKVYAQYISEGKLTLDEACNYGNSHAKTYCRKTCGTCQAEKIADTCEDKQCVTKWRFERGKCFSCDEWKNFCSETFFAHDCPRTCGMCKADGIETTPPLPTTPVLTTTASSTMPPTERPTMPPACEDSKCVESWLQINNVCHKCSDYAEDYCGRDEGFMKSCPKSCRICSDGKPKCFDDFLPHTCKRYTEWGWCSTDHIADHCKASCGLCSAEPHMQDDNFPTLPPFGAARRQASFPLLTTFVISIFCAATLFRPAAF